MATMILDHMSRVRKNGSYYNGRLVYYRENRLKGENHDDIWVLNDDNDNNSDNDDDDSSSNRNLGENYIWKTYY